MESFSLLKYWRGGGGGVVIGGGDSRFNSRATTVVTAVPHNTLETDNDNDDDDDDDGPFFDLEFAVPDDEEIEDDNTKESSNNGAGSDEENDIEFEDDENEFNFTLSSDSSTDRVDQNLALSPCDDLFFKGRLVPVEETSSSTLLLNGAVAEANNDSNKPPPHQFPVSFLKSATKFRVFMLGFKKSKMSASAGAADNNESTEVKQQQQQKQEEKGGEETTTKQSKFFTIKFKVEEVPLVSLFTRENSKNAKSSTPKQQSNADETVSGADEKRFSKDVMQRYLKKVKPLYIRVSKRYGEKLRFSGQLSLGSGLKLSAPSPPNTGAQKCSPSKSTTTSAEAEQVKSAKAGNLPAGLRVVCKHLGKSRSASSAAVSAAPSTGAVASRRDDSLLQQQDGIQSAILHCKRSFNASRESDSSLLSRSISDSSHELCRKSSEQEGKDSNPNGREK